MEYALLIARQRSGTGALGSVLDKHPQLKYLGEVFHPENYGNEVNFFTYLERKAKEDSSSVLPDRRHSVFLEFLDEMSEKFPNRKLIVDVKYRSLHHLNGGWSGLTQVPEILRLAKNKNAPILHLTRRNALQTFVSGRLAEANKVWHADKKEKIKVTSAVINIRHLSGYIVNTQRETALVQEWTSGYPRVECFDYEEMFDELGLISITLLQQVAELLGVHEFADRAPNFVKQAPRRVEDSVENYDLVKHSLIGSGHEWMLHD